MTPTPEAVAFARLITALHPYRDHLVVIGGWAHQLSRFHPLLVLGRRRPADRAKDVLYVRDTLVTFGRALADLQRIWTERLAGTLHAHATRALRMTARQLSSPAFDAVRAAARVAQAAGRPLSPEEIAEACRAGLPALFG